jgi:hypothetical protein
MKNIYANPAAAWATTHHAPKAHVFEVSRIDDMKNVECASWDDWQQLPARPTIFAYRTAQGGVPSATVVHREPLPQALACVEGDTLIAVEKNGKETMVPAHIRLSEDGLVTGILDMTWFPGSLIEVGYSIVQTTDFPHGDAAFMPVRMRVFDHKGRLIRAINAYETMEDVDDADIAKMFRETQGCVVNYAGRAITLLHQEVAKPRKVAATVRGSLDRRERRRFPSASNRRYEVLELHLGGRVVTLSPDSDPGPIKWVGKAYHFVRGHVRVCASEKRTWVRPHYRGNKAFGEVTKDYEVLK